MNPSIQSEKQVFNGWTKDKAQLMLRRNYCRGGCGSALLRNDDNHEPGCLVFIFTDLFLIFNDAINSYRT